MEGSGVESQDKGEMTEEELISVTVKLTNKARIRWRRDQGSQSSQRESRGRGRGDHLHTLYMMNITTLTSVYRWTDWTVEERNATRRVVEDDMWQKSTHNEWYQWVHDTARMQTEGECILCAAHKPKLEIVPHSYRKRDCKMEIDFMYSDDALCPTWCLMARAAEIFVTGSRNANRARQKYYHTCSYTLRWPMVRSGVIPPRGAILNLGKREDYECFKGVGSKVNVGWFRGQCNRTIIVNYSLLKEHEKAAATYEQEKQDSFAGKYEFASFGSQPNETTNGISPSGRCLKGQAEAK